MLTEDRITAATLEKLIGDADSVSWDLRYRGQSFELTVADLSGDSARLRDRFEEAHERRYGYRDTEAAIELVTVRRRYIQPGPDPKLADPDHEPISGPASVDLQQATLYLPNGWRASPAGSGLLRISHTQAM